MEYKNIQEQFNKVISYSQNIPEPKTDELFEEWLEAKRDFIEAFGGKLILEFPVSVSFELSEKEKNARIEDFIDMIRFNWQNEELSDFLEINKAGFFQNRVMDSSFEKVPKGMKLLKSFKYFEEDKTILETIQNAASMIIQEDKIEGTLCLSVHPLDYLSMSENNHNWRSCHALNGDYRSGNLSYMVDSSTVVCYLRSKNEEVLPDFPSDVKWNSKKWRVLLFFSEKWDVLFAGRQYPFATTTGLNFIKNEFLPSIGLGSWCEWTDEKILKYNYITPEGVEEQHLLNQTYYALGNYIQTVRETIVDKPGSLHFNDLLHSSSYVPLYTQRYPFRDYVSKPKILIGGSVKCCRCGQDHIEINSSFMCNECELEYGDCEDDIFATCPCCGNRYIYDEGYWIESTDETICPSCAENECERCDNCGELVYKSDVIYDRKVGAYICKYCKEGAEELEDMNREFERSRL